MMAFFGVAAVLAVSSLYDDGDDEPRQPLPRTRGGDTKTDLPPLPDEALPKSPDSGRVHAAKRADDSRRPVHLSVSAGDAEFLPANLQQGSLRTTFTVKDDELEI